MYIGFMVYTGQALIFFCSFSCDFKIMYNLPPPKPQKKDKIINQAIERCVCVGGGGGASS